MLAAVLKSSLPLSGVLAMRLAAIDAHDFTGVKRKVREDLEKQGQKVTDEYLNAGIVALKQYYAIAIVDGGNMHAISDRVDPFWHAHILHTKDYAQFCQDVAGYFMHHDPLDHGRADDVSFVAQLYDFTMERYKECFSSVDRRFYPEHPDRRDLVCTHGNDDIAAMTAIFPRDVRAQAPSTWH